METASAESVKAANAGLQFPQCSAATQHSNDTDSVLLVNC